jgi:hypothetical protein
MWACCTTRVKNGTEFTFKNGTRIKARDPDEALDILKSINLREDSKVFKIDSKYWAVHFGEKAQVRIQATEPGPGTEKARKKGEWLLYLDRRDPQLIGSPRSPGAWTCSSLPCQPR